MTAGDGRKPVAVSLRSGRIYQPGIGPHPEDRAVDLTAAELAALRPDWLSRVRVCYPESKQTCDVLIGAPGEWAIEVKMFRPNGDNGKPDGTAIRDILSPFSSDRSALTDCVKLGESTIAPRRAVLIYGFDDARRPLKTMIEAFERLANDRAHLGARQESALGAFAHPIHTAGAVFAWQVGRGD